MAYRKVYFRIRTEGYTSHWSTDADKAAFKEESRQLFQKLGWTLDPGENGVCDTVTKDRQDLYLHPTSFSGVIDVTNIQSLQEQLSKASSFSCYAFDCYEEYRDLSDEEYRAELEAKRGEITDHILAQCQTKRSDLYITAPIAIHVAERFEICRLCDKDRHNKIGDRSVSELMDQLLQKGWLVTAKTAHGDGIRTATAKERKISQRAAEQVDGQIALEVSAPLKKASKQRRSSAPSL